MKKPTFPTSLKWGIISGLMCTIIWFVLYITNEYMNNSLSWVVYIGLIAGSVLGMKEYRNNINGGVLSYGTAFGIGFMISMISGTISSIIGYVMSKWVDTGMMDAIKEKAMKDMIAKGMSDEMIDKAMQFSSFMFKPEFILIGGILGMLIFGTLLSLIIAAIMKKDDTQLQEPTSV